MHLQIIYLQADPKIILEDVCDYYLTSSYRGLFFI